MLINLTYKLLIPATYICTLMYITHTHFHYRWDDWHMWSTSRYLDFWSFPKAKNRGVTSTFDSFVWLGIHVSCLHWSYISMPFSHSLGTLMLFSIHASIVFDSRATHSFILKYYANIIRKILEPLKTSISVFMPSGEHIICNIILKNFPIEIQRRMLLVNLIISTCLDLTWFWEWTGYSKIKLLWIAYWRE